MPTMRDPRTRSAALMLVAAIVVVSAWLALRQEYCDVPPLIVRSAETAAVAEPAAIDTARTLSDERVAVERLAPQVRATLHVHDCAGLAQPNVRIEARSGEKLVGDARTDMSGSAILTLPADTPIEFHAHADSGLDVETAAQFAEDTELDLILEAPGTALRARVIGLPSLGAACRAVCIPEAAWDPRPAAVEELLARRDVRTVNVDADGRFAFCSLVPGIYRLAIGGAGFRPPSAPLKCDTRVYEGELVIAVEECFGAIIELCAQDGGPLRISELAAPMSRRLLLFDTVPELKDVSVEFESPALDLL